jgi:hypothetical protein
MSFGTTSASAQTIWAVCAFLGRDTFPIIRGS